MIVIVMLIRNSFGEERHLELTFSLMGPIYYILIALPCTIGAMAVAVLHIYKHLLNYTEPTYQRYIVRIIFMVPVSILLLYVGLTALHCSSHSCYLWLFRHCLAFSIAIVIWI